MKVVISPVTRICPAPGLLSEHISPLLFAEKTKQLYDYLSHLELPQLKQVLRCSDKLTKETAELYRRTPLDQNLTPAILAFHSMQFTCMSPDVFDRGWYEHMQRNVRIISPLYGLLRPFDGIVDHRLEIRAKIDLDGAHTLYDFWGDLPSRSLFEDGDRVVLDLTTPSYSWLIRKHMPADTQWIHCRFGVPQGHRILETGVRAKMARGALVRSIAQGQIEDPDDLKTFQEYGYRFSEELSQENQYVFVANAYPTQPAPRKPEVRDPEA